MIYTVEKEFRWEAAHRLVGHDDKGPVKYCDNCANLHGHSYKAIIKMRLANQEDCSLDHYGMVYDYNKMKKFKKWIDENLDHSVMISNYDLDLLSFIRSQEGRDKHFIIHGPSTAETLCQLLFKEAGLVLNDNQGVVCEVRVKETESSEARYGE
jgi:6-pyruvoyl tetrahydropterin synthase/QueD family protein